MVERRINLQRQGVLPIVLENQMVLSFDVHLLLTRTESTDKDCLFHLVCFPSIEVSGNIVDALRLLSFVLPMRFVSLARVRQIFVYDEKRKNYFAFFLLSNRWDSKVFHAARRSALSSEFSGQTESEGNYESMSKCHFMSLEAAIEKGRKKKLMFSFDEKPTKILLPVI